MSGISGSELMSSLNFISKYAKHLSEENRRETFEEAVDRMVEMHLEKYLAHSNSGMWAHGATPEEWGLRNKIEWAFDLVKDKRLLASQRVMQFAGPGILRHEFRGFNCSTTYIDRPRAFAEIQYLLLCGCGVGYSIQKHHVSKLPDLYWYHNYNVTEEHRLRTYTIEDSIEGWADAFDALINSYFVGNPQSGIDYQFDCSRIRPQGSPLSTGGKAPGPMPLQNSLEKVRLVLEASIAQGKKKLSPLDCHDIICHMSDSVLSGGLRRSALISLFSFDDEEMMNAKTGNWYEANPQRGRANNSAMLLRSSTQKSDFLRLFEKTKEFGEPGFIFVDTLESTYNPCQPGWATVCIRDESLKTGWRIGTISELKVGDRIWSEMGWATVLRKWSTGVKDVWAYHVRRGIFYGTPTHQVVDRNRKIEAQQAQFLDCLDLPYRDRPVESQSSPSSFAEKIEGSFYISTEEVFDIMVDNNTHTYWTGGVNVSNCSEINLFPTLISDEKGNVCDSYTLDMLNNQEKYKALGYTYESGVAVCNLCEINGAKITNLEDFLEVVEAAAIIGTLQAGYTKPGYLTQTTQKIVEREALLGISLTGMMDNPHVCFDDANLTIAARRAKEVNKEWAAKIGIRSAARVTTVKPAGNSTILLGCQGSGIHPPHSKRLIRRVQVNKFDPIYQEFKLMNPHMCEESVWSPNKTDDVISFPLETSPNAITKDDITAIDFLQKVYGVQNSWVKAGNARPESVESATHNVSNTVVVGESEWDDVADFIWFHRNSFSGLSLMARSGDFIYEQAPMQKIWFESELVEKFGKPNVGAAKHVRRFLDDEFGHVRHIMAPLSRVLHGEDTREVFGVNRAFKGPNWTGDELLARHRSETLWKAYGMIRQLIHLEKTEDIITLLAAVDHERIWNDLVSQMVEVDYSQVRESEDNTKQMDTIACGGGGACELDYVIAQ